MDKLQNIRPATRFAALLVDALHTGVEICFVYCFESPDSIPANMTARATYLRWLNSDEMRERQEFCCV